MAIEEKLISYTDKTQTRLDRIESNVEILRLNIAERLDAVKALSLSSTNNPALGSSCIPCDKSISSIQIGLRDLNRRIRKNNIVLHGLVHTKQDCIEQAANFFQTDEAFNTASLQTWLLSYEPERSTSHYFSIAAL